MAQLKAWESRVLAGEVQLDGLAAARSAAAVEEVAEEEVAEEEGEEEGGSEEEEGQLEVVVMEEVERRRQNGGGRLDRGVLERENRAPAADAADECASAGDSLEQYLAATSPVPYEGSLVAAFEKFTSRHANQ